MNLSLSHFDNFNVFFNNQTDRPMLNSDVNEEKSDDYIQNILITISYSLIVIISLVGNTLVFKTIAFQSKMRNSTNILIAVLAVSDLLMTIFNIPFTVVDIITRDWLFGQFFCTLVSFVQANCVYVSSFTMAVIAINRFQAVYRTRPQVPVRSEQRFDFKLLLILLIIWVLAALHSLPHTIFNGIVLIHGNRRCYPTLPETQYNLRLILTLETFVTQYIIPLSCAGVIYTRISFTILSQGRVGESTEDRARQMTGKKRRRISMLILVVTIFALCWLPFNVYYLLLDFEIIEKPNFVIFLLCHWLAMSSVCYNPFVYCWLNENFRKEAKRFFTFILEIRNRPAII
ncbi:G-protein coupled receptor 83-like [Oppia nitens]|uniref:G-protein coupled receptor 83-like n=1 Tax=Oppia nitens TaxID=1686743 RepID=UPI0023DA7584|nr:G-protein coupled receptor 83-like [Oppia nitens]